MFYCLLFLACADGCLRRSCSSMFEVWRDSTKLDLENLSHENLGVSVFAFDLSCFCSSAHYITCWAAWKTKRLMIHSDVKSSRRSSVASRVSIAKGNSMGSLYGSSKNLLMLDEVTDNIIVRTLFIRESDFLKIHPILTNVSSTTSCSECLI